MAQQVQTPRSAKPVKRVPFSAKVEGAKSVCVTGDFTRWSEEGIPLAHSGDGEWKATLGLAPGEYQYRLRVDGRWQDHAEAKRRVPNAFGTENCVLTV